MPNYTQAERPLEINTPLGKDIVLATGFRGHEEISRLFEFEIALAAELGKDVKFDAIVGQKVTLTMRNRDNSFRYFNGFVRRFTQQTRDESFVHFRAVVVPKLWFLTKKVRSRVFQHLTAPDILKQVLADQDVTYEIAATYHQRDYCVQYRESDFDFACRLMEEEGIYFFFKHADGSHQMIVTDIPNKHPAVAAPVTALYEEATGEDRNDMRVTAWEKTQEVRAGEYTLWDYCFEVPTNHLEAKEKIVSSVPVGKITHKLNLANDSLELYDYPGRYAQRFDGIAPNGGDRPTDITHIFEDRTRTVRVRMEQEEINSISIRGDSDCGQFTAGHKFTLERHFDADASYLLTRIEHEATDESYRGALQEQESFVYKNTFSCVPESLRYRPQRVTLVPVIPGIQTATVVGPKGEEIWVDKYGRVKIQFHWDREGKMNADSSCWVRVSQVWAGKGWGSFFWPRIGHEVIVTFEEGDPDQPIVTGSVYNADNMPWYTLPKNKQLGGFKSASTDGSAKHNFNGLVFNDEKGKEHLSIHSEHNLSLNSETNKMVHSGRHKGERVGVASMLTVGKFLPVGGGSGGGFDEGNPVPDPQPQGITGLNSVVTFGDAFQAAGPFAQSLTMGTNLQMCVTTGGLVAGGLDGIASTLASLPPVVAQLIGSASGAMQFTIGASNQFTLGQSFEISVGPPKIELHKAHNSFDSVRILSLALGLVCEIFWYAYDLAKGSNQVSDYTNAPNSNAKAAALSSEESGDQERAILVLVYQALTETMLIAIMFAEYLTDTADWLACDAAKTAYEKAHGSLGLWKATPKTLGKHTIDPTWSGAGQIALAAAGLAAMVVTELAMDSAGSQ